MIQVIPFPKAVKSSDVRVKVKPTYRGIAYCSAIRSFFDYADRLLEVIFQRDDSDAACFVFELDVSMPIDEYRIKVTENGKAFVRAQNEAALSYAFATLILCFEKSEDGITLPVMTLSDAPDSKAQWRGLMLDLARKWIPVKYLFDAIDLCWLYKINRLQLHFTDDQSFTLPCRSLPKLSTEGRTYTYTEIAAVREYAAERGVMLIPEVDMPGHCAPFQTAYSEIFGSNRVMCVEEKTFYALETLINEVLELFPDTPYIHLGGDEARIANWKLCSGCLSYIKEHNLQDEHAAYAHYLGRITQMVLAKGKTPIIWEGFSKEYNELISKEVLVIGWESYYQVAPSLLKSGFTLINCSWQPLYVVPFSPGKYWDPEEILDWNMYTWRNWWKKSFASETPIVVPSDSRVMGGQLCMWGDAMTACPSNERAVRSAFKLVAERLPALAERTWNPNKTVDKEFFCKKLPYTQAVLSKLLRNEL